MKQVTSEYSVYRQQAASVNDAEPGRSPFAVANSVNLDDLIHEVRQPLGTIESIAYYLELISVDEKVRARLQHIQALVSQVNRTLERAFLTHTGQGPESQRYPGVRKSA